MPVLILALVWLLSGFPLVLLPILGIHWLNARRHRRRRRAAAYADQWHEAMP